MADPLYRLTEKGQRRFQWTPAAESAFAALKTALILPPILAYPISKQNPIDKIDPDLRKNEGIMILDCDASLISSGAVLSQIQDGQERVLAYYRSAFSKEQRNYCATRRELLSLISSLKHFEPYLSFRKFAIRTDNSPLRWIQNLRNPEQQIFRWLAVIQAFDFGIFYRAGRFHSNADALSRRPCDSNCRHFKRREEHELNQDIDVVHANHLFLRTCHVYRTSVGICNEKPCDEDALETAQLKDPDIAPVLTAKKEETLPPIEEITPLSSASQYLFGQWDRLTLQNNKVLCRTWYPSAGRTWNQIVTPYSERFAVLLAAHNPVPNGRFRRNKMADLIRTLYYWPEHLQDITLFLETCEDCLKRSNHRRKRAPCKFIIPVFQCNVSVLIYWALKKTSESGNRYLVTLLDNFTKWPEVVPVPDATAKTVASALL